jgi:polysaccharide biosynthesis protein PelC
MLRKLPWPLLFAALALGALGCGPTTSSQKVVQPSVPSNPKIAVMPFENLSGKEKAGAKLTEYFMTLMIPNRSFRTIPFGESSEILRRFRVRTASLMTDQQIDSIAVTLGIDYLLTGTVLEYDEFDNTYLGKIPQVSFNTRLIECSTKKTVWVGVSNGSGDQGELLFGVGAVRSADELAKRMATDAINRCAAIFTR